VYNGTLPSPVLDAAGRIPANLTYPPA
jgi:hypothetical protein